MAKAIFTADQLETLLSRVLATMMEKFDVCMDKMLDKFETRLVKLYGDLSTANRRIDKLEQAAQVRDQVRDLEVVSYQHIRPTGGAISAAEPFCCLVRSGSLINSQATVNVICYRQSWKATSRRFGKGHQTSSGVLCWPPRS